MVANNKLNRNRKYISSTLKNVMNLNVCITHVNDLEYARKITGRFSQGPAPKAAANYTNNNEILTNVLLTYFFQF